MMGGPMGPPMGPPMGGECRFTRVVLSRCCQTAEEHTYTHAVLFESEEV